MSAQMASRLLFLLSLVENALQRDAVNGGTSAVTVRRIVNYPKGLARLTINDTAGGIFFQHFDLADGAICLRATMTWSGRETEGHAAIYPQGDDFNWQAAATRVAAVWLAGPQVIDSIPAVDQVPAEALRSAS